MGKYWVGLIAGVLVAVITAAAGCGGDESASGNELTTTSLSQAEYIEKADAICKETEERLQADFGGYIQEKQGQIASKPSDAEFGEFVGTVVVPNLEREIEEIHALGAPDGDKGELEDYLLKVESGLERAEDEPQLVAIKGGEKIFESARQSAQAYGFKVCD